MDTPPRILSAALYVSEDVATTGTRLEDVANDAAGSSTGLTHLSPSRVWGSISIISRSADCSVNADGLMSSKAIETWQASEDAFGLHETEVAEHAGDDV